jgi:steroid 5-alpha reductase family enzyme
MTALFIKSAVFLFIYATIWFVISLVKKRNDIADIAWGLGYVMLSIFYLINEKTSARSILINTLVIIWGLRLALHIFVRNRGKKEDFRYLNWRIQWKNNFYLRSYLQVYLLQAFFLLIIISPVIIVSSTKQNQLNILDYIGVIIWLTGFLFESVADYQLLKFSKRKKEKDAILKTGLWKYSRHPNYFGEVLLWWGIFLIAVNSNLGLYSIIGPLTITILILFVSGIPMLEKHYLTNKDYLNYKNKTSLFFPLPPKN